MIIDAHTHIFPKDLIEKRDELCKRDPFFSWLYGDKRKAKMVEAEGLITSMDQFGIQKSVISGFSFRDQDLCRRCNDYILEVMTRYPERLIGFASSYLNIDDGVFLELERCLKLGMKGIGELNLEAQGVSVFDDRFLKPLVEMAQNFSVPLMIHTNEKVGHSYPGKGKIGPSQIYQFITTYPQIDLILAHWGGGLFFYELMPEVKEASKRVYYDIAASPFLYAPTIYSVALKIIGEEKILLGTDYPFISQKKYLKEIEEVGISEEVRQKICGENLKRLLRLDYEETQVGYS